ncbi:MAG: hypothetical protein JO064_11075 [Actinobacteria bacterium]|nr:hypothetical protein [Actinomycetota bacterium]
MLTLRDLGFTRGEASRVLFELRLFQRTVATRCELTLVRLDLMLQRVAQLTLTFEGAFELRAQVDVDDDRGLVERHRLEDRNLGLGLRHSRAAVVPLAQELCPQTCPEALLELVTHFK